MADFHILPRPLPPLFFCLLLGVTDAGLAATDYYSEADLLTDIPLVSAGSRMSQTLHESPSSVTVIDSEMIAALSPNNLVDLFRLVPGFVSFYINGSLPGLSGHDATDDDPRRLEVRVNGRSVYVPAYPTISWESLGITPDDIERIEVVRGSNVPIYGSNAILGAVDITTKSPLQEGGSQLRITSGSQNTRNLSLRSNFKLQNGYAQLRASKRENEGFDGLEDQTDVGHIVFNAALTPSLADTVNIEVGFSKGSFGLGDGDHVELFADDKVTSYWLSTGWARVEEKQQWKAHLSYYVTDAEHSSKQLLSEQEEWSPAEVGMYLAGAPDPLLDFGWGERKSQLWEAEIEHQYAFSSKLRSLAGVGYKLQQVRAPLQLEGDGQVDNHIIYAFSNIEWRPAARWLANVGVMIEDQSIDEVNFSPRASIHFQVTPEHNLRISGSRTYRTPSLFEARRYTNFQAYNSFYNDHFFSDDDLKAERLETVELGYYGSFFDGKLLVDWRLFHEDMEGGVDHIKWRADHQGWSPKEDYDGKAYFFSNAKDWVATGYDMQVKWQLGEATSIALQHANTRLDLTRVKTWNRPPEEREDKVPEHISSLLLTHRFDNDWAVALMSYQQSFVDWRAGKDEGVDAFKRHDITLSKQLDYNGYDLEFSLKVDNVTDERYVEYQEGNYFGRYAYFNFTLGW
jgi:iron complex outermembrane recepter protein